MGYQRLAWVTNQITFWYAFPRTLIITYTTYRGLAWGYMTQHSIDKSARWHWSKVIGPSAAASPDTLIGIFPTWPPITARHGGLSMTRMPTTILMKTKNRKVMWWEQGEKNPSSNVPRPISRRNYQRGWKYATAPECDIDPEISHPNMCGQFWRVSHNIGSEFKPLCKVLNKTLGLWYQ